MYEASDVVAIGNAHELILGVKPFLSGWVDQEGALNRNERIDDIDESDD